MSNLTADRIRPRVALWLHDGKGRFLVQDDRHRGLGLKFPGGGIEAGQAVNEAARQEALEEVGYELAGKPRAIPGIRAKTVLWDPVFLEEAAKKGRHFKGSKHYHRIAEAGARNKELLGSEGDALKGKWLKLQEILEATRASAANPDNKYNYFDEERLRVAEAVNRMLNNKTAEYHPTNLAKLRHAISYRQKLAKLNISPAVASNAAGRAVGSGSVSDAAKQVSTNQGAGKALTSAGTKLLKAPSRGVTRLIGRAAKSLGRNAWLPVDAAKRGLRPALKDAMNPLPARNQGVASSIGNFLVDSSTAAGLGTGVLGTALAIPAAARAYTQLGQLSGRVGKMRANERIKLLRQGNPRQERIIAETDPRLRGY